MERAITSHKAILESLERVYENNENDSSLVDFGDLANQLDNFWRSLGVERQEDIFDLMNDERIQAKADALLADIKKIANQASAKEESEAPATNEAIEASIDEYLLNEGIFSGIRELARTLEVTATFLIGLIKKVVLACVYFVGTTVVSALILSRISAVVGVVAGSTFISTMGPVALIFLLVACGSLGLIAAGVVWDDEEIKRSLTKLRNRHDAADEQRALANK